MRDAELLVNIPIVTPYAFDAISWKYYNIFIASLLVLAPFYWYFLTEMNQMTLERIAGNFGDDTISDEKIGQHVEGNVAHHEEAHTAEKV